MVCLIPIDRSKYADEKTFIQRFRRALPNLSPHEAQQVGVLSYKASVCLALTAQQALNLVGQAPAEVTLENNYINLVPFSGRPLTQVVMHFIMRQVRTDVERFDPWVCLSEAFRVGPMFADPQPIETQLNTLLDASFKSTGVAEVKGILYLTYEQYGYFAANHLQHKNLNGFSIQALDVDPVSSHDTFVFDFSHQQVLEAV